MKLKFWIGILVSVLCLYLVFKGIDSRKVVEALKSTNYPYLVLAALVNLSAFWPRAKRWKYLLEPIKKIDTTRLFPVIVIGFMATNLLPARAGELIRAYVVGKKEEISKSASFATIVLERVLDSIIIIGLLVMVFFVIDFENSAGSEHVPTATTSISLTLLKTTGIVFTLILLLTLIVLVLLKLYPTAFIAIVNRILFPVPLRIKEQITQILSSFSSGLQVLQKGAHFIPLLFWSIVVWMMHILAIWITLIAFGLHLPFYASTFILVLTAFAVAVPSSPGFIGPFHAAVSAGLIFFAIDRNIATSFSLILHIVTVGPVTLIGLFYLWLENLSFYEIKQTKL